MRTGYQAWLFAGAYRQPLLRRLPAGQDGVIPACHGVARSGRRRVSTLGFGIAQSVRGNRMFFVWFYAALSVARRSGQGFNAWSFADKPCVTLSHYGMRAVAVGLLPLRHVHLVHWVHQVHLDKCFVTKLAPQLCFRRQTAADFLLVFLNRYGFCGLFSIHKPFFSSLACFSAWIYAGVLS